MCVSRRGLLAAAATGVAGAVLPFNAFARCPEAKRAEELVRQALVINGNMLPAFNDDPMEPEYRSLIARTGLTAVKYSLGGGQADFAGTVDHIGYVDRAIARHAQTFLKVREFDDIIEAKATGRVGIIYAFEDAGMFEGDVERIGYFHDLGVRSMQLSYNGVSTFASGVMAKHPSQGLTEVGRQAVVTMNNLGVTIDTSHSDDKSTLQIIEQSAKPVMISHGGCAGIYSHPRNKSDHVLRKIADQGGIFGLYELAYLTPGQEQQTIADFMRHLKHAINVCGVDHVGIGSDSLMLDFDTSPESMKNWSESISARKKAGIAAPGEGPPPFVKELNSEHRTALIIEELLRDGLSETDILKIVGGNFARVFEATWV